MTFPNTTPQEFAIFNGLEYHVASAGGDCTIKRQLEDGTWLEVDGSPVTDGTEKRMITHSANGKIQVTPSASGTEFTHSRIA